jgi:sec-independent protein translocase protein TatB
VVGGGLAEGYSEFMFGLTFEKLLLIGIIAVFLLGPERLPHYAAQLARLVRSLRDMANGAKDRMRDEMGPDFDDVDWKKLDPRQYDPRRIIREALNDTDDAGAGGEKEQSATISRSGPNPEGAYLQRKRSAERAAGTYTEPAPFDSEAT